MSKCSHCVQSLEDSQTMATEPNRLKSCPRCSQRAGHHVFYRETIFGTRDMGDGRIIIQSWCPECRSDQTSTRQPDYTCA